jgi:Trypsin-like peptidase domain
MRTLSLLVLAALLLACAPAAGPAQPSPDSVVALLGKEGPPTCLRFPEETCSYADRFVPVCGAFAVVHYEQTMLATAAHCVPEGTTAAPDVHFWAPSGWGHGHAGLVERDNSADVAFLGVTEPGTLEPLRRGPMPLIGETVHSYSPVLRESSAGRVSAWLGGSWFETTQTAAPGWSGAPVLNEQNEVVGLVSKCPSPDGLARGCAPGRVIVATWGSR